MSTTIDQRVVEMRFDNSHFESNAKQTMTTLDKLKSTLNFDSATKGLTTLQSTSDKVTFNPMSTAIEQVKLKFSALEIMGIAALTNITNSAINTGKSMISALTIDPIKTGFEEYEIKMNAIQTIMSNTASKGTTMSQVTDTLDELNTYADKTIYNFAEMTRNIGTFTAAGVDLETSASAIKGIANLAAASGSSSLQASTAMYQLSQAIAAGKVNLQDWNSVVNAGMGGQLFQDALKETAQVMGVVIDESLSFRESISGSASWLTSDILIATLEKFTGDLSEAQLLSMGYTEQQTKDIIALGQMANDAATKVKTFTQLWDTMKESVQSGWSQTWEIVIGDFEEAKLLLTEISDAFGVFIGASADARNQTLQEWKDLGGRTDLIDGCRNVLEALLSVLSPIQEAFRTIFPPATAEDLYNITASFKEITSTLKLSDENAEKLKKTFEGVFAIFDILATLVGGTLKVGMQVICQLFGQTNVDILSVSASVGEAILKFRDWLKEQDLFTTGISKGIDILKSMTAVVKEWIQEFMQLPVVQTSISTLVDGFKNMFSLSNTYFSDGIEKIGAFIEKWKNLDTVSLDGMTTMFADFNGNVSSHFLDVTSMVEKMKSVFADVKTNIQNYFSGISGEMNDFAKGIQNFFTSIATFLGNHFGEILTIGLGVILLSFTKQIADALTMISEPLANLNKVILGVSDVLGGFTSVLNAYALKVKSEALMKVAISIAILAGSIALLTLLDQSKVWSAIGALGALAVGLIAVTAALGYLERVGGTTSATGVFVMMAGSLLILVTALKQMEDLDNAQLLQNMTALGVMALGLVTLATILSKVAPQLSGGSITFIAIAASLKILISALEDLQSIEITNAEQIVGVLLGIIAGLALVSNAAKGINLSNAIGIIAISAALHILIDAIEKIATIDTSSITDNIEAFIVIMVAMSSLMVISKLAGSNAIQGGVAMIAMSVALIVMMQAVKIIANVEMNDLHHSMSVITQLLALFGVIVVVSKYAGDNALKAGVMLLLMSGAILILTAVIVALSHLDASGLDQAMKAITTLGLVFAALIAVTKLAADCKATLIILSATIAVLAIALGTLSMIDPVRLQTATAALSILIGVFALLVASTSLAQQSVVTLVILTAVVVALGVVLYKLAELPMESSLSIAKALATLLTAMSASLLLVAMVGTSGPAALIGIGLLMAFIVATTGLMVGIGALVTYFPAMEEFLTKGLSLLEQLGTGLGTFAGNLVGGFLAGATSGLPQIGTHLSEFMTNLQPFLSNVKNIDESAANGVKALAETMLILIGINIADTVSKWFTGGSSATDFAEQLVPFGKAMCEFAKEIKDLDSGVVERAAIAGKALAEMASSLPNSGGVLGWFMGENDMDEFAKQLIPFGRAMNAFSLEVQGLDANAIVNSATAGQALAELAQSLPNTGGVVGWFMGENDMSDFATQLVPFGMAMKSYSIAVQGLDADAIINSATAGQALAELAQTLPNTGGVIGWFTGENDMQLFGQQLLPFGMAMKSYSIAVQGLDADAIVNSATAGQALVELANTLPNTGGVLRWFTGNNDIGTFGASLVEFGRHFSQYSLYMKDVNTSVVSSTTNVAKSIVELQNSLPKSGGWFNDNTSLEDFGKELSDFGRSIASYASNVSSISTLQLGLVIQEVNKLVDMARGMTNLDTSKMSTFAKDLTALGQAGIDGFISAFTNANSRITDAAKNMVTQFTNAVSTNKTQLTTAFQTLVNDILKIINDKQKDFETAGSNLMIKLIAGIKTQDSNTKQAITNILSNCITAINDKQSSFETAGSNLMKEFISGIKSQDSNISTAFTSIIDDCLTKINNKKNDFYDAGSTLVKNFINGIQSQDRNISSSFTSGCSSALSSISGYDRDFYNSGKSMAQGFANGISDYAYLSERAASNMASAASAAVDRELDIHSPSRVAFQSGSYFGSGFVNALDSYRQKAYTAAESMASSAKNGLQSIIATANDLLNAEIDTQPTIRPVLDLSEVTTHAKSLNTLFSRQQALSIQTHASQGIMSSIQPEMTSGTSAANTYTFTQNNYSPKALSRVEIYRQTSNQFAILERSVKV
ncbi:MAG: tape measure protein [Bacillota bacterium]